MKNLRLTLLFLIIPVTAHSTKFDSQNITGNFVGLHCIGTTKSKLSNIEKKYDEYLLLNTVEKYGMKWRGSGRGEFVPLEGSWSFRESSISGLGIRQDSDTNKTIFFSFDLNRLNGSFDEKYMISIKERVDVDDISTGKCAKVNKFPKPIM